MVLVHIFVMFYMWGFFPLFSLLPLFHENSSLRTEEEPLQWKSCFSIVFSKPALDLPISLEALVMHQLWGHLDAVTLFCPVVYCLSVFSSAEHENQEPSLWTMKSTLSPGKSRLSKWPLETSKFRTHSLKVWVTLTPLFIWLGLTFGVSAAACLPKYA